MTTFSSLSREEKLTLFTAWVDGKTIEVMIGLDNWEYRDHPQWSPYCCYRIAVTPDTIDWSHVSPEFTFMARDANNTGWVFRNRPSAGAYVWSGDANVAEHFASYHRGTVDWKDSLVERPA